MTGKVINLRTARKAKARLSAKDKANENAARFGLSKAERAKAEAVTGKAERHLDQHKREE